MKKREDMGQLPLPLEPRQAADVALSAPVKPGLTLVSSNSIAPYVLDESDDDTKALAKIMGYSRSLGW